MSSLAQAWSAHIPQDWRWAKLNRVARLGTGHTPDRTKPEYWTDCDIPWVTAADLSTRPSAFVPLMDTEQKVSQLGITNSAAVVHPAGTVMFCRTASVGLFCIIGRDMATTQAFVTWTPGETLHSKYLLYVVAALRPEFDRLAYGSTHLTIYMPDLEALRVPMPPFDEQRRIVDFLDDQVARIDNIIAARRQQVTQIEEMKASAVQSALLVGGSLGLAFPWFRKLPDDTMTRHLRAAWSVIDCKHRTPDYVHVGYPVVSPGDIAKGPLDLSRCTRFVDEDDWLDLADDLRRCRPGDIVYARNASAGSAALVQTTKPFTMGQDVCRITSIDQSQGYLAHVLNYLVTPQLEASRVGSTITRINVDQIKALSIPVPAALEQQNRRAMEADRRLREIERFEGSLTASVQLLEERKRSLITAAVTGGFDVSTASRRAVGA